jgi:pantoate--beta-alanine ligase
MIIAHTISKVRQSISKAKRNNKIIGFVPTMGALHQGHLSLVRLARKKTDFVVVSIFVNPLQFAPGEDFSAYPRNFRKDNSLLKKEKINLVFYPTRDSMYSAQFSTYVEEVALNRYLCGVSRPLHFRGVCTIVAKLFNIIQPDISYFGQKDYQQVQIIKAMVRDLNFSTKIVISPIVREKDGLAMSSRNIYLTTNQRKQALCLYRSLELARQLIRKGTTDSKAIIVAMKKYISNKGGSAKIDYINIVDPFSLKNIRAIKTRVLVAVAVRIGKVRLIDNMII